MTKQKTFLDHIIKYMRVNDMQLATNRNEVNIVAIEGADRNGVLNDDEPNHFNDLIGIFTPTENGFIWCGLWKATTEPGRYYTENRMNPRGAARIKFGQYKAWQVGWHNGDHQALVQAERVTVHRDGNQDFIRTGDFEDTGLFGINLHWGFDQPLHDIGRSSAGCLVIPAWRDFTRFMHYVYQDPRYLKNREYLFNVAILPGNKVIELGRQKDV
jgi:hypothetical protein